MKKKILGLLALALLAGPCVANAIVITISGFGSANGQWNITPIEGSADSLAGTLDDQVWWGDEALAASFASELQDALGYPNGGFAGPLFAVTLFSGQAWIEGGLTGYGADADIVSTFATATRVPEPRPLALLGLGLAGLGLTRRRKTD